MADNEKQIKIGGRKLTVHRQTFGMQLKRFTMMENADKDIPFPGEGLEALVRNGFHRIPYPSLAACTSGTVPTEPDCYDVIANTDLEVWVAAARELNPLWFPNADETSEEKEKKS